MPLDQEPADSAIEDRLSSFFGGGEEPAQEEETPAVEASDDQAEVEAQDQPDEESKPDEAVEDEAIELDGRKLSKAELKAELDKASDYTRKSQEVAGMRKVIETQNRIQSEHAAFTEHARQEIEQLQQIEAQLEQYRKVDLSQIDSETLSRMSMMAANLREERARLQENINGKRGEFKSKVVAAWDEMATNARNAVLASIPEWDRVAKDIAEYAISSGYPFEVITGYDKQTHERVGPGVVDPVFAKTLYKAMQWDRLQQGKATAVAKATKAPPTVTPGASKGQGEQTAAKYKEARQRLAKSGDIKDAARLFMMR